MTPFERDWGISAGGPVRVFDTALGLIGIAICYDSEFPLLVRAMAEAGAELHARPLVHRARVGLSSRAYRLAGARAGEPDRHSA